MNITKAFNRRQFLVGTSALTAAAALHPYSAFAAANQAHLRIMETTDIPVNLLPYDYYADKPNDTMGLSRTASIIDSIRSEATNSMLVDNGDLLQGNPMGDYIAYERGMKDGGSTTTTPAAPKSPTAQTRFSSAWGRQAG
jgi:2',3'-cyclic-nucleotide 2'-phosphodiesterase/3'-nucleotidase